MTIIDFLSGFYDDNFRENTMYVNMEVGKEYSLEDLGL